MLHITYYILYITYYMLHISSPRFPTI